jgi:CRP-like cAMP-binding protein
MQSKLGDVLNDTDRLESRSLNESDGGEECDAILTAIRRAKRRALRRGAKLLENGQNGEHVMVIDEGENGTGKALPNLRLTLNGH